METLKNNYLKFLALIFPLLMNSQSDLDYHEASNILFFEKSANVLDVGVNYNL